MSFERYKTHFKEIIEDNTHLAFADTKIDAEIIVNKLNELDHEINRLSSCEAIINEVNNLLDNANRELAIVEEGTHEYSELKGKIKVLNQLHEKK